MIASSRQRDTDAAFFEDWSEWASLTGEFGERVERIGNTVIRERQPYGTYYCALVDSSIVAPGRPGFEIALPPHDSPDTCLKRDPITMQLRRLPDLRRHPRANWEARNVAYHRLRNTYFVPAHHWRVIRAVLPALKAAVIARAQRQ